MTVQTKAFKRGVPINHNQTVVTNRVKRGISLNHNQTAVENGQAAPTPEAIQDYSQKVVGFASGHYVSMMVHLGDRLGLYKILAESGDVTVDELAEKTGLHRRWLLEWLRNQASAGLIEYKGGDIFALPLAAVPIIVDDTSPANLAGFFNHPIPPEAIDRIAEAFHTGLGPTYDDQGIQCACNIKRLTAPGHGMLPEFFKRADGLTERLEAGAKVIDVGCGTGDALRVLAHQYPNSTFVGYDPSAIGIEMAQDAARAEALTNVSYIVARGEDLPQTAEFDVVLTLDCLHDMTFPQQVINAIRGTIKPDGIWIIKDIRSSHKFEDNLANPASPLLYGISILVCMASALSEPGGAGLGTLGFNPVLGQQMTQAGGFSSFKQLDIEEDPMNYYYQVRI
ncbi:MAG: class I SAM-dependent methyltransferase [Chloroflexota bacterium]